MEIVIVTGMSGAGKSQAITALEDMGFFCIDNLPPQLLPGLLQAYMGTMEDKTAEVSPQSRLALVMDVRSSDLFGGLEAALEELKQIDTTPRIIFLEASDRTLISRYKQSRRNHPLAKQYGLPRALATERERLAVVRSMATNIIDTSDTSAQELRDILFNILSDDDGPERMAILIQSFGFKYGIPVDCDCILDVRFIPNPFYVENLRAQSGLDAPVQTYINQFPEKNEYLRLQYEVFRYTLPFYQREGKVRLTIGVGCTGGRHRSVAISEELSVRLRGLGYRVIVDHRDIRLDLTST